MQSEEEQGPERVHEQDDEERLARWPVAPRGVSRTGHVGIERRPDRAEYPIGRIEGRLGEASIPALDFWHRGGGAEATDREAEGDEADEAPGESRVAPFVPLTGQGLKAGFHGVIFDFYSRVASPRTESACHPSPSPSF